MADPVWVDDVTPLDATNMNKLQTRDEKAQINGYPSLDSSGRIPIAQLPESGIGAELTYEGDYAPATTYQDGDVVVKDGIAYLCVGGPTTVAPDIAPWGGASALRDSLRAAAVAPPGNDLNLVTASGWYNGSGMVNAPIAGAGYWFYVHAIYVNANYQMQEAWEMIGTPPSASRWWRQKNGGTWSAWTRVNPGYGTSLPASPSDGQEYTLVDSLTNSTYQWRFRYNAAATSAYKWEFVGGSDAFATVPADESSGTTGWVDLATVGPRVIVPRPGEYAATAGCSLTHGTPGTNVIAGITVNATDADLFNSLVVVASANGWMACFVQGKPVALAAGDDVRLRYWGGVAGMRAQKRTIAVRPVRVS
jgi:hypothetical protein